MFLIVSYSQFCCSYMRLLLLSLLVFAFITLHASIAAKQRIVLVKVCLVVCTIIE